MRNCRSEGRREEPKMSKTNRCNIRFSSVRSSAEIVCLPSLDLVDHTNALEQLRYDDR